MNRQWSNYGHFLFNLKLIWFGNGRLRMRLQVYRCRTVVVRNLVPIYQKYTKDSQLCVYYYYYYCGYLKPFCCVNFVPEPTSGFSI